MNTRDIEAIHTSARKLANTYQQTYIIYQDCDELTNVKRLISLEGWERMLDNGQVEENWIIAVVEPS